MASRNDNIVAFSAISVFSLLMIPALLLFIDPAGGNEIPPRFWATMSLAIAVFFCFLAILVEFRNGGRFSAKELLDSIAANKRQMAFLSMALIYVLSVDYLGFLAATLIMLPLTMFFYGLKRKVFGLIVSTIYVLAVFFLFQKVFKISFPAGMFF